MVAATVPAVYAAGLLELADAQGVRSTVVTDCATLATALRAHPALIAIADSPRLSRAQAKALLRACFIGRVRVEVLHLLLLLVDRNRLRDAQAILAEVQRRDDADAGRLPVIVTTVVPVDPDIRQRIEKAIAHRRGANAHVSYALDKDLLAGLKVQIGAERVLDGTSARHLREIRQRILATPISASWATSGDSTDHPQGASA